MDSRDGEMVVVMMVGRDGCLWRRKGMEDEDCAERKVKEHVDEAEVGHSDWLA